MPAVTLNTRTDLNTSKAKLGTFELTTTTTVNIIIALSAFNDNDQSTGKSNPLPMRMIPHSSII